MYSLIFENVKLISGSSTNAVEQLLHATKDDLVMCISFPRYSRTTVDAVEYAKSKGASVVAITDSPMSPISDHADCALYAMSDTASFVDSLVAPMSLINALIGAGFMIEECQEARISDDMRQKYPALFGGTVHRPEFIFFRCRQQRCTEKEN